MLCVQGALVVPCYTRLAIVSSMSSHLQQLSACVCQPCACSNYPNLQRLRIDEFESGINQEDVNKADFLERGLNFLAPVSLEDRIEPTVAKAVRSMVHHGMAGLVNLHVL